MASFSININTKDLIFMADLQSVCISVLDAPLEANVKCHLTTRTHHHLHMNVVHLTIRYMKGTFHWVLFSFMEVCRWLVFFVVTRIFYKKSIDHHKWFRYIPTNVSLYASVRDRTLN